MKLKDGGPAFPVEAQLKREIGEVWEMQVKNGDVFQFVGLTIRDHFAGLAMQSLLDKEPLAAHGYGEVAEHAYLVADRMLEARDR